MIQVCHEKINVNEHIQTSTVTLHPIYLVSLHVALFKRCVRLTSYGSQQTTRLTCLSCYRRPGLTSVPPHYTRHALIPSTGEEARRTMKINTVWLPMGYDFKKAYLKIKQLMY